MTLTAQQKKDLKAALADMKGLADQLAVKPSGVAALGALAAVGTTDGAGGAGDAALAADVDARLTSLQAKLDALIAALTA